MVIPRADGAAPRSVRRRGWVLLWLGVAALLLSGLSTVVVFLMSFGDPGPDAPYTPPPAWVTPLFWAGLAVGAAGVAALAIGGTALTRAAAREAARATDPTAVARPPWEPVTDPDGIVWFRDGAMWWPSRSADRRQVFDGVRWAPTRAVRLHRTFWIVAILVAWLGPMAWTLVLRPGGADDPDPTRWLTWVQGAAAPLALVAAALSFVLPHLRPPLGPARGRRWVWTSPPGWPAPPAGFVPDLGWRPNDAWPDPPVGWRGWHLETTGR